ncbi:MAG TPA: hypothetical protein VMG38_02730 [Trebonia sp.]|nr:hypothetical protein [Trebonia sp.]
MTRGQETQPRPTLLSSCARATTAAESRYRISAKPFTHRSSRVIALDHRSAAIIREVAAESWGGGHFLVFESALPDDALLRRAPDDSEGQNATTALLSEELDGADTVVMVASAQASATAASLIGDAAAARGIMTAGLVVPAPAAAQAPDPIVAALRPNAMVLVVLRQATDLAEVLSALRV